MSKRKRTFREQFMHLHNAHVLYHEAFNMRQLFVSSIDCRDFLWHQIFLQGAYWKTPIPKSECCYTTLDTFLN